MRESRAASPWVSVALLVAALLYGVSPVDLIADVVPVLGLVDDVGVFGAVLLWWWRQRAKRLAEDADRA